MFYFSLRIILVKIQHDNQNNKNGGPPHRAKLVPIPDQIEGTSPLTTFESTLNPINTSQYKFPRKSSNTTSPATIANTTTTSTTTVPLSSYMNRPTPNKSFTDFQSSFQSYGSSNPSSPLVQRKTNNSSFIDSNIPIQITNKNSNIEQQTIQLQPSFKIHSSFIRPKSDQNFLQACAWFDIFFKFCLSFD